jgi:hypothetical protein
MTRKSKPESPASVAAQMTTAAPVVTVSLTMADLLAKGKAVTHEELARSLAAINALYAALGFVPAEFQGTSNVPVPVELLAIIGEKLVGRTKWLRDQSAENARASREQRAQWQRRANDVWRNHPDWSIRDVQKAIAPGKDHVRKLIKNPTKP